MENQKEKENEQKEEEAQIGQKIFDIDELSEFTDFKEDDFIEFQNYEQQRDELELFDCAYPDVLTYKYTKPKFLVNLHCLTEDEKDIDLEIYLPEKYPDFPPRYRFYEKNDFLPEEKYNVLTMELFKLFLY